MTYLKSPFARASAFFIGLPAMQLLRITRKWVLRGKISDFFVHMF